MLRKGMRDRLERLLLGAKAQDDGEALFSGANTIRNKSVSLFLGICGIVVLVLGYSVVTFSGLKDDSSRRSLAGGQLARVKDVNLQLTNVVNGHDRRGQLLTAVAEFELVHDLLEEGGTATIGGKTVGVSATSNSTVEADLQVVADLWGQLDHGVDNCLTLLDERQSAFDLAIHELAPLLSGLASLEREYVMVDEDEFEYHIESVHVVREEIGKVRNEIFKFMALNQGDELDQTRLSIELSIEKINVHLAGVEHGSDDLELDPTEDEKCLEAVQTMLGSLPSLAAKRHDVHLKEGCAEPVSQ